MSDQQSAAPALHPQRGASVSGQKFVVLGLARQGLALARWLVEQGTQVTISDMQPADQLKDALESLRDIAMCCA
jgi:UDP-N-acetylmuramoylalanine-D-glutamate ligase